MPMTDTEQSIQRLVEARHHDPFELLGWHPAKDAVCIRIYRPGAVRAWLLLADGSELNMHQHRHSGLFYYHGPACPDAPDYQIRWEDTLGQSHTQHDVYRFPPILDEPALLQFHHGQHFRAQQLLGAHCCRLEGIDGVRFAVWAPNAQRVSVVGLFNQWDGRIHPMRNRGQSGVWELFIPDLNRGELYKFEIRDQHGHIHLKTDPYGQQFEMRPATAAIVQRSDYRWQDQAWLEQRAQADWLHQPMSIYELHPGSWQRNAQGEFLSYQELAEGLIAHVQSLGFTHIELMPITEHPFDASWGYQTTGYFAPTSRFGDPDGFRYFVDQCHLHGIGVILDWVPAHFPKDSYALALFDGTPLYEHADPRRGEHRDWGTLIFNFGRNEVKAFLLSSALYWLEEFHIDALRVDAVASMLYLDYSRQPGDWIPNVHGGNENLEAISFLREMNILVHREQPGALTMAEESTSWPMVSRPVDMGGLGFSMKWNMGWMHDTLSYFHRDPIYRQYHQDLLTFGMLYAFTENFVLPFSHDEVVHMKRSMLDKMPGDEWQRFANLRLIYTYMYAMPGKKLLFMGAEFAQGREWNDAQALDWHLYARPHHHGIHTLLAELNRLYREESALHRFDFEHQGFQWLDCDDRQHSVLSFLRRDAAQVMICSFNFTPQPRDGYRIGVPEAGDYQLLHNSDAQPYGGSGYGEYPRFVAETVAWMGQPYSIVISLPPLAGLYLQKSC
ncbi:MAG: 1,4-alpha-glucan branching protein GlgB [Chromatiales bacterium]|nr:1,4-alpha-glucan branching protein GlgB [Gammaproteobacteria bacterium]MBW6476128.1 1,4-alpha-glucan branching protein GlgB [Chromatiales bacterium]